MRHNKPEQVRENVGNLPFLEHSPKSPPDGYRIVSVRLREAEFEAFSEQVNAVGLTNNMALRVAARRIGGFLEVDAHTRHALEGILQAIGSISREITQMHVASARSGMVNLAEFSALRASLGSEFARLDATLLTILNIADRRLDGRLRLKDPVP